MKKYARHMLVTVLSMGCAVVLAACGSDDVGGSGWSVDEGSGEETEYGSDTTVITKPGDDGTNIIVTGDPDECVDVDGECVDLDEAKRNGGHYCDDPDAQADVIVVDGEVVDVVCYPPKDDGTDIQETDRDEDGNAEVPRTDSGTVVTFSEDTNGEAIEGDITIESERITLYGNGVDKTIIDGDVSVTGNNSRIRGVTITGDVDYSINANGSAISFCKIYGNLTVNANNYSASNCKVFGDVNINGNGALLMNIGVQGAWNINPSAECHGCYSFDDDNGDFNVDDDEVGDELTCGGGEGGGGNNVPDLPGDGG